MGGGTLNVFLDEPCADEVSESFRTVQIACPFDEVVKPFEEISVNGDAESCKSCHRNTFFTKVTRTAVKSKCIWARVCHASSTFVLKPEMRPVGILSTPHSLGRTAGTGNV